MSDKTVAVEDPANGGHITLSVDGDGDLNLFGSYSREMWVRPAELVAALRELGVLPPLPEVVWGEVKPITASDRVRESWRAHAATDANERPTIDEHVTRQAEIRRLRAERAAGPRFYRDRDGDVWREHADGKLTLHKHTDGRAVLSNAGAWSREGVQRAWGPLTEVQDPASSDPYAALRRTIRDRAARAAGVAVHHTVPTHDPFVSGIDARYMQSLRAAVRRDISSPSVWRNFS